MSLLYSPRWSQILELQNCSIRPGLESTILVTFLSTRGRVIYKEAYDITWVPEEQLIVTLGNVGKTSGSAHVVLERNMQEFKRGPGFELHKPQEGSSLAAEGDLSGLEPRGTTNASCNRA